MVYCVLPGERVLGALDFAPARTTATHFESTLSNGRLQRELLPKASKYFPNVATQALPSRPKHIPSSYVGPLGY